MLIPFWFHVSTVPSDLSENIIFLPVSYTHLQYTWFHHQMDVEWFENNNAIQRQEMLDDLVHWYQN